MQFTFNIPDAQVPRVAAWVRSTLPEDLGLDVDGNPVPEPTNAELLVIFKNLLRNWIKREVQQYELLEQHKTVFANYTQIDVQE